MKVEKDKAKCMECSWKGRDKEILKAPNPFDKDETVIGCPQCKSVDSIECVCDEPDCWMHVSCGTPMKDGSYRNTCGKHYALLINKK